jgi:hypothetical protein
MRAVPGLIAFLVGAALLGAPWWSSTLPRSDYPLVAVLGTVFSAIGVFAALPESWPRLRALFFALFMAMFGLVCAALALTPLYPAPDGTWTIGGVAGFVTSGPMPRWARIVAGFFAIVGLGTGVLGLWGLARVLFGRSPEGGAGPTE